MTTYNFTHKEVFNEVIRVADSNPDFVYAGNAGCSYLGSSIGDPTGQCCIVGQALQNLGVSKEDLLPMEGIGATYAIQRVLGNLSLRYEEIDPVLKIIGEIQGRQDAGTPWGEAVQIFKDQGLI